MEYVYFTKEEAEERAALFSNHEGTEFTIPKSGHTYKIFCIMATPANAEEQDELRDLMQSFVENNMEYTAEMMLFDSRMREDKYTISLFAIAFLKTGLNLLSVSLCPLVGQGGQIEYGFEAYSGFYLF